jgi:hypothetical protein
MRAKALSHCDREIGFTALAGTSRCRNGRVAFIDFSNRRQSSHSDFAFDAFPKRDGRNQPDGLTGDRESADLQVTLARPDPAHSVTWDCVPLVEVALFARNVCGRWGQIGSTGLRGSRRLQLRQRPDLHSHAGRLRSGFHHLPVEGSRTRVPALRAGTLRRLSFSSPGNTNSPTPRGWTEARNKFSSVA